MQVIVIKVIEIQEVLGFVALPGIGLGSLGWRGLTGPVSFSWSRLILALSFSLASVTANLGAQGLASIRCAAELQSPRA